MILYNVGNMLSVEKDLEYAVKYKYNGIEQVVIRVASSLKTDGRWY